MTQAGRRKTFFLFVVTPSPIYPSRRDDVASMLPLFLLDSSFLQAVLFCPA